MKLQITESTPRAIQVTEATRRGAAKVGDKEVQDLLVLGVMEVADGVSCEALSEALRSGNFKFSQIEDVEPKEDTEEEDEPDGDESNL